MGSPWQCFCLEDCSESFRRELSSQGILWDGLGINLPQAESHGSQEGDTLPWLQPARAPAGMLGMPAVINEQGKITLCFCVCSALHCCLPGLFLYTEGSGEKVSIPFCSLLFVPLPSSFAGLKFLPHPLPGSPASTAPSSLPMA